MILTMVLNILLKPIPKFEVGEVVKINTSDVPPDTLLFVRKKYWGKGKNSCKKQWLYDGLVYPKTMTNPTFVVFSEAKAFPEDILIKNEGTSL